MTALPGVRSTPTQSRRRPTAQARTHVPLPPWQLAGTPIRLIDCPHAAGDARRPKRFRGGTMAIASSTVESRETASLIGSDKVEGTAVYGADQKKIGRLERVMLDKISG